MERCAETEHLGCVNVENDCQQKHKKQVTHYFGNLISLFKTQRLLALTRFSPSCILVHKLWAADP
jgi:hypothetical protein